MCTRRRGFSLIEMLIVLAVLAGLIAVIAPIGVNTLRKSHAVSVAKDLKTLSSVFSSKIYLGGELPEVIGELGRNVDGRSFGAAWKKNDDGQYNYFVFTNRSVDFETVSGVLIDSRQGIPFGIDDFTFLDGGLGRESLDSETIYYSLVGENSVAPLTEFGSTFDEISEGLKTLIQEFFVNHGRYPRDWIDGKSGIDYRFEDLSLDASFWANSAFGGVVYKPAGKVLRVSPDNGYKFVFNFLGSSEKGELTERLNWDLIYNIGNDSADTDCWYFHSLEGRKIDISTLEIVKIS